MKRGSDNVAAQTIAYFSEQMDNCADYGSVGLLADIFGPLLDVKRIRGTRIADTGSGTRRVVNMRLEVGAAHVIAIEPSDASAAQAR